MKDKITIRRQRRQKRVRNNILGTSDMPRLSVHRSLKHIYAQLIDDVSKVTLLSVSTSGREFKKSNSKGNNKKAAEVLGKLLAEEAKKKGFSKVKFDRGRFIYHGRIKTLAESARKNGMVF